MKTWLKTVLITLVLAIPAFMLGPILWEPSGDIVPTAAQLPLYILLSVFEALAFGYGVSFLLLSWKYVAGKGAKIFWAYLCLGWLLVSWWPHDNLHIHNGLDPAGLLLIEYGFHVTLMLSGVYLSYYVVNAVWSKKTK